MGNPRGSPLARNIGIKESKGEYIAFLDDDDEWKPEKIEEQVKILDNDNYKNIGLCISWILDKRFGKERINKTPDIINHKYVLDALNLQSTSAYMFRASSLKEQGGFDLELASAQEYDLALRASKNNVIISIPKVLVIQNATEGQISENWTRKIKGIFAIRKKYKEDYSFSNNIKSFGLVVIFSFGYIFGNKIYKILTYFKEKY
jgi:glycosyltransferase involved in cell wall biosynthesis